MTAASNLTTKEFAAHLSTDPRTLRKFLRSITPKGDQPGKGSRWELAGTKTAIAKARKQFAAWQEEEAKRNAARLADAAAKAKDALKDSTEGDEDPAEDLDPTDEDLELAEEDSTPIELDADQD